MRHTCFPAIIILLLLASAGCKPTSGNNPVPSSTPDALIARIIHISGSGTGRAADTTVITYNTDSSIQQINYAARARSVYVFSYSPRFIKRVTSSVGVVISNDSIVLNQRGECIAEFDRVPNGAQYDYTQYFSYNAAGELIQAIKFYPNNPGMSRDTASYTWQNGDLIMATSTIQPQQIITYTFDVSKQCCAGDLMFSSYQRAYGRKRMQNAHLCTGFSLTIGGSIAINYSYDSQGRISGYGMVAGQTPTDVATYDFVP